jgi:hypothetical protein
LAREAARNVITPAAERPAEATTAGERSGAVWSMTANQRQDSPPGRRTRVRSRCCSNPNPVTLTVGRRQRRWPASGIVGGSAWRDRQLLWRARHRRKSDAQAFDAIRSDTAPPEDMTADLDSLMANLSAPDRDRLKEAFAADPELATGLCTMLADLPFETQELTMRRLAVHLEHAPLGGGALIPALADVIRAAMERSDPEPD